MVVWREGCAVIASEARQECSGSVCGATRTTSKKTGCTACQAERGAETACRAFEQEQHSAEE